MRLSDFDYELPRELVAQEPLAERDASRLMHLSPDGSLEHLRFVDLPGLLEPGDLLVMNDTRVFPARLLGRRSTGAAVELFLLEPLEERMWRCLGRPARKLRCGDRLVFSGGLEAEVTSEEPDGRRVVSFTVDGEWDEVLEEVGRTPLPPYIDRPRSALDESEREIRERYQTVYAHERGSVAAPTAGLHFTESMIERLEVRGVEMAPLTLHVGYATFEPLRSEEVEANRLGVERFLVPERTAERVRATKERGRRVVAVGTTSVRALESAAREGFPGGWRETDLFITPGFEFRVVDGLLTNFHLPKSSLLLLVAALGGAEPVLAAYRRAVERRYRFYSFGDAMLLYPARYGADAIVPRSPEGRP